VGFFHLINKNKNKVMNRFANKSIERYEELISKGISSDKILEILLSEFVKKKVRKAKIKNLFNI
jgi:uncharacterized protein YoaH (UPF0181 family)